MKLTDPKPAAILRVALFIVVYFASLFMIGMFDRYIPARYAGTVVPLLSVGVPLLIVVCFRVFLDRKPVRELGLEGTARWGYDAASGFAVGACLMSVLFIVAAAAGWISFRGHFNGGMVNPVFLAMMLYLFASSLFVAFSEELVFRGYILRNLTTGWGVAAAVAVSAVLFGAGHVFNPSFSWLVVGNLVLGGVLIGYGAVTTKSLWWPIGFHLAWNFFEGSVFGFPVSGVTTGYVSLFITHVKAPSWLMGGSFGPEGGLAVTVVFLAGLGIVWLTGRGRTKSANA